MKTTTLMIGMVLAAGFSTTALAHDYGGTLGSVASATDKFYVSCATRTVKITYQIRRNSGKSKVLAKSISPAAAATTSSRTLVFSPLITVNTGGGAKFFQVNKSPAATGTDSYTFRMNCYGLNSEHNPDIQPAVVTYIQNQ